MKISIVIPAYNEQTELPACLASVDRAVKAVTDGFDLTEFELIVTDNNSSDQTAEIARNCGATVVFEPVNQIAKARNTGAAAATGDWLLFIDADSRLHPVTLRETLQAMNTGHYGAGGCLVWMDDAPFWGRNFVRLWNFLSRTMRWAAGSFIFCRHEAFRDVGGFDEQYFAAEELYLSQALKKWCRERAQRFVILRKHPHKSSARKFHLYSGFEIMGHLLRTIFAYGGTVRSRAALDFFYDGRR